MGKQKIIIWIIFVWVNFTISQNIIAQDFVFRDSVYVENIKSVKLATAGNQLAFAAIPLGSDFQVTLYFDDLDASTKEYAVSIIHCNKDWTPSSQLNELEYLKGFDKEPIRDISLSFNTFIPYIHYSISLPNDDIGWKISGNYLLKVVNRDNNDKVVITRRIVVYESLMQVVSKMTRPVDVSKSDTHQELDYEVRHPGIIVRSPRTELSTTVLQNNRWDNCISDIYPIFSRSESENFDYQDKIVFEAGKEFRFFDMRGLNVVGENILTSDRVEDGYEVVLRKERINNYVSYLYRKDINGNYVIGCYDNGAEDCATKGDYAYVYFTLASQNPIEDKSVYITGAISDWGLKPEFKMTYNESQQLYEAEVLLKQGYYNYQYTLVDNKTGKRDDNYLQGNWFETENSYSIIVYYRAFGERYDRVVGYGVFDSRQY